MPVVDPRRWSALAVLLAGTFLSPLDFFIVNVALPSIRTDLHADPAAVQMVLSGYSAAYAVCLVTGGRLGDIFGRRRVFMLGMIGFGLSSCLCGVAWSADVLVLGRVLQGASAAVLMPQSLASIRMLFPEHERARAMGWYAATFGLASVIGQVLGGLLIALDPFGLGWRSVFLVNLPVVMVVLGFAHVQLREQRAGRRTTLDVGGVLLLGCALTALIVPLVEGREQGWPRWTRLLLCSSLPLLLLFWRYERRVAARGREPLFVPAMFGVPGLRRGLAAAMCFNAIAAFFFVFAVYEQAGQGHTPFQAGLATLPLAIGFLISPLASPWVVRRLGSRTPMLGLAMIGAGMFATAWAAHADQRTWLVATLFLIGLGQGLGLPTLVRACIERVDGRWAGLAAGLVNSTLQISAALAVALVGGLFYASLGQRSDPASITHAFVLAACAIGVSLWAGAALAGMVPHHPPLERAASSRGSAT